MRKNVILLENQSCNSKPYDSHLLARQLSALHHRGGVSGAFAESDRPLLQPERCRRSGAVFAAAGGTGSVLRCV